MVKGEYGWLDMLTARAKELEAGSMTSLPPVWLLPKYSISVDPATAGSVSEILTAARPPPSSQLSARKPHLHPIGNLPQLTTNSKSRGQLNALPRVCQRRKSPLSQERLQVRD